MAGRAVSELLSPEVILREVSRIKLPGTVLADLFGWGLAARDPDRQGGNMIDYNLRDGQYEVFNRTRRVSTASVPGTAPTMVKPKEVGKVRFTIPRAYEKIHLKDEDLSNQKVIGQAVNIVDEMGLNYINKQKRYLMEGVANLIEFQTAALIRGSYTYDQEGDELRQLFTGGSETIDFQVPANNKNQLNGIIGASWATASTDIPADIHQINEQSNANSGLGIEHAVCNSATVQYVSNNDKIKAQAGTSNTPFATYERSGPGRFRMSYRALPWLEWHIVDYSLDIWDGTSAFVDTNLIADDHVHFFPTPSSDWVQYCNGGEVVTEGPGGARAFRTGYYAYGYPAWEPSGWNLANVFNGFPMLYVPAAIFDADVTP